MWYLFVLIGVWHFMGIRQEKKCHQFFNHFFSIWSRFYSQNDDEEYVKMALKCRNFIFKCWWPRESCCYLWIPLFIFASANGLMMRMRGNKPSAKKWMAHKCMLHVHGKEKRNPWTNIREWTWVKRHLHAAHANVCYGGRKWECVSPPYFHCVFTVQIRR